MERTQTEVELGSDNIGVLYKEVMVLEHCFHDTGICLTSNPPIYPQICCYCGAKRSRSYRRIRVGNHGPFVEPTYQDLVNYSEPDRVCSERTSVSEVVERVPEYSTVQVHNNHPFAMEIIECLNKVSMEREIGQKRNETK